MACNTSGARHQTYLASADAQLAQQIHTQAGFGLGIDRLIENIVFAA
jgi:aspartyl/asparaginyl-tRNA synthetase